MPPAAVTISSGTYRQKEPMIFFASPDAFLSSISLMRPEWMFEATKSR